MDVLTENQEQRQLVKWIRDRADISPFVIKITNEGRMTVGQRCNLILMGLCPGASDLFIAVPNVKYHGLWIEMKRNKRYSASEMATESWISQEDFQKRVRFHGYAAFFCYGFDHAKKVIESYFDQSML